MSEILQQLRIDTAVWHAKVEQAVPVFGERFTMSQYRGLLESFYGFYAGFEPLLAQSHFLESLLPDWRRRLRVPGLVKDLTWLGYSARDIADLPVCSQFPEIASPEQLLGAMYVTEGSTLGGVVICHKLEQTLALRPDAGATFFGGHGSETKLRWKLFQKTLGEFATAENERRIIASATLTFESIWLWLSCPASFEHTGHSTARRD